MARTRRIPKRERWDPSQFATPLSSGISELVLIILLFIHALLCFAVQKFARYCKLPIPCLLCSRLDRRQSHFYKELICHPHELEISSLAYCRSHQRLTNGQEMCKGCLLADGSNANFLRKKFIGEEMIKVPLLKKDLEPGSQSKRCCSCCLVPLKSRPLAHRLLQRKHVTERDAASLSSTHLGKGLAKEKGDHRFERVSQTGYNELKIASESESEVPFSDDARSLVRGVDDVKRELLSRCLQAGPAASAQDKLIHPSPVMPDTSVSIAERRLQGDASHSKMSTGHGLEEINWNQGQVKPNVLISSEILIEQVPTESVIPKLEVPDHSGFASNGDAIKASSADIGLRVNEKLASNIKVPFPSPASSEVPNGRESSRVPEELRSRLSQISTARWLEFPWNEMSATPGGNGQGDESKLSDTSSLNNLKRPIIDRYESGVESLDGSFISEIEGESNEDRLKRQIEMDRKLMGILYKELEEERNASAISANQAMSMINRLQEEKAAIQMEALQYLRMMEEQTEYDQEALQKLDDLLSDRDKEIQDLEAVVESYRKQFGGEIISGVLEEPFDCEEREYTEYTGEEREYTEYTPVSTPRFMRSGGRESGKTLMRNTMLDFEDEKLYISESLRRLERKLILYSYGSELSAKEDDFLNKNTVFVDAATGNDDDLKAVVDDDKKLVQQSNAARENSQTEEMNIAPSSEGSLLTVSSASSIHRPFSIREALKERRILKMRSVSYNGRQFQMGGKWNEIVALGNEISQLSVRLEALEEDRNFLEHAVSSLRNGSNGIQFVQEIACHLRELRQIGITHQERIVA